MRYDWFEAISEWNKKPKKYEEKLKQIRKGKKEKEQVSSKRRSTQKASSCLWNWWPRLQRVNWVQKSSRGSIQGTVWR